MSREQRDTLLNELLPLAQELLEKHGEFFPFAGAILVNGEASLIAGATESEEPPTQDVVAVLVAGLTKGVQEGHYRVTGICYEATVTVPETGEQTDAVCIEFEDFDEAPAVVVMPYTKEGPQTFSFGELFATPGERRIFPLNN